MADNKGHVEIPPTAARQAANEGIVRYVLVISLALVIVAFVVVYLVSGRI
jgi:hypothetical protein